MENDSIEIAFGLQLFDFQWSFNEFKNMAEKEVPAHDVQYAKLAQDNGVIWAMMNKTIQN
ncbi:MAG: hypothetical protein ACOYN5_11095 [Bacteroidales bacterium]